MKHIEVFNKNFNTKIWQKPDREIRVGDRIRYKRVKGIFRYTIVTEIGANEQLWGYWHYDKEKNDSRERNISKSESTLELYDE